jgi:hypothetical protein
MGIGLVCRYASLLQRKLASRDGRRDMEVNVEGLE